MNHIKNWACPKQCGKGWLWLFLVLAIAPLTPEYVSPFFLTIGYIVFLKEHKRSGLHAELGMQGKSMALCLGYFLIAACWSATALFSAAMAGLLLWMFLAQLMISNLCTDKRKLHLALSYFTIGSGAVGAIGLLQLGSRLIAPLLHGKSIVPDPFFVKIDTLVFRILPFSINERYFDDRSSSTFTNPNILATLLVVAFPIALYLMMQAKNKHHRLLYLGTMISIFGGIVSTKSRIAFVAVLLALVLSLFSVPKKKIKFILPLIALACLIAVPMLLTRFKGTLASLDELSINNILQTLLGGKSSKTHMKIWKGCIDYLSTNPRALWIGLGGGVQNTWDVLMNVYKVNQPHAHNLILETVMEYGIVGLLLFITPFVVAIGNLFKLLHTRSSECRATVITILSALLCYLLTGLTDYPFNTPKQIQVLFILFGFTQAIYLVYKKKEAVMPTQQTTN